ncbi:MAG: hypothetical protein PHH26_08545 [Candidatus Thermoplasmatota archaeon]|nr:hypothetical protein [Candidatus Thermoplasmatota archaeon]
MKVKLDELAAAIMAVAGVGQSEAMQTAMHMLNIFGYESQIIDNVLDSEDRSMLRILEDERIITTSQDDCILEDGREWRIHYWKLNMDAIKRVASKNGAEMRDRTAKMYEALPPEAWTHDGEDTQ